MLPKSHRRSLVGFDDGSKSVKYYNAEMRKVLTSRNFRFLSQSQTPSPPEQIEVNPDALREGELGVVTPIVGTQGLKGSVHESDVREPNAESEGGQDKGTLKKKPNLKRKRVNEESENESDAPQRTRGKRVDYRHLNDPFSEDEDEDINVVADISNETFSVAANDGAASLKEARKSDEWPEWEKAIKAELTQLQKMGTWQLVKKPQNAIPIAKI